MNQIPEKISRYVIAGELGVGAMGVVYQATDPNIDRTVALKTMRLDVHGASQEEMLRRFKAEAKLAGVMNHPNIVTIYDAGEFENVFFIAMEYIQGNTLQSVLHDAGILRPEEILRLARAVCAGMDYAHRHDVVHRDIKPANIMLGRDGSVKIMDFGIAKSGAHLTSAGTVLGTPTYMSPEQVRGKEVDGRSDLFSFGVCLYEMATGEKPFAGQNVTAVIYKIMNEEPAAPRSVDSSVPPGIEAAILRALAKDPDIRYQSGAELVEDLEKYRSASAVTPPKRVTPPPPPAATAPAPELRVKPPAPAAQPPAAPGSSTASQLRMKTPAPPPKPATVSKAPPPKTTPWWENKMLWVGATGGVLLFAAVITFMMSRGGNGSQSAQMQSNPAVTNTATTGQPGTDPANPSDKSGAAVPRGKGRAARSATGAVAAEPVATTGSVQISSTPAGAKVQIAGTTQADWVTPFTAAELDPGVYDVTITHPGYVPQTLEATVAAGKAGSLNVRLIMSGAQVSVSSTPAGGFIWVDGKPTGKLTPATVQIEKGQHTVEVRKAGFVEAPLSISAKDGDTVDFSPTLDAIEVAEGKKRGSGFFRKVFKGEQIPEGKGLLALKTRPAGAQVTVDGAVAPNLSPIRFPLDPGSHDMLIRLEGHKPVRRLFHVEKGQVTELEITLDRQ
ncbi:MAG: serine/threonine protein kinase [Acidobacteriales bacterium]|nr:serine/threonine protein kinase [Terriglobales bacterium]